jgi:HD superfamily phosphohydrolase
MPEPMPYEVRCPLHGSIPFNERERLILDHPLVQRLRAISQLGFAHLVYPGATHTRFSHALGVMHLAGRIWDRIVAASPEVFERFRPDALAYCRQVLRFAGLLHDAGHLPFSHSFEPLLPPRIRVSLPKHWYREADWEAPARHEDLSIAVVHALCSDSSRLLCEAEARDAAALIHGEIAPGDTLTGLGGAPERNPYPLLKQIISGEIDADRMDYLPRDAHFAGVAYGFFDLHRLIESLSATESEHGLALTLDRDALFTYENFLMARFHMAMQVYFHKTLLPFERYLERAVREGEIAMPYDGSLASFERAREDVLMGDLHAARGRHWAGKIVSRQPAARLIRLEPEDGAALRERALGALRRAGIPPIHIRAERRLSTLGSSPADPPIRVAETVLGTRRLRPLHETSQLLRHYNRNFVIERIYCEPVDYPAAVEALKRELGEDWAG